MAEAIAGAVAAEQILSTGVEASAAAAIARPTQLKKGSISHIQLDIPDLARSNHTLTVIGDSAFIFGGKDTAGQLCSTNVHELLLPSEKNPTGTSQYASYHPSGVNPVGTGDPSLPSPRYGHAACSMNGKLVIHGGRNEDGPLQDESSLLWLWDTRNHLWTSFGPEQPGGKTPMPRHGHCIFFDGKNNLLVLHGGRTKNDATESAETWMFDLNKANWLQLPFAPAVPVGSVFDSGTLYNVTTESDWIQSLHIPNTDDATSAEWSISETSVGPQSVKTGARATVLLKTGMGRCYLIQLFGMDDGSNTRLGPDVWSLQLPAGITTTAGIKDVIRDTLPKLESGTLSWVNLEISSHGQGGQGAEKTEDIRNERYPGPRTAFGVDSCGDGRRIILWGGISATGDVKDDGWIMEFQ